MRLKNTLLANGIPQVLPSLKGLVRLTAVVLLVLALTTEGVSQGIQTFQSIRFYHPNNQGSFIGLLPPTGISSYNLTLPATQGAANSMLVNNGSGLLSWATINGLAWQLGGNTLTGVQNLGTVSNHALPFITNNVERMRITEGGFVGIGIAAPTVNLDVVGMGKIQTATTSNLFLTGGIATNTGTFNTAIGVNAFTNATTAEFNTGVGAGALRSTTTGAYNTAFGNSSLFANTTGSSNFAIGGGALLANTTGSHNGALGIQALEASVNGTHNLALGNYALSALASGNRNIGIGWGAGGGMTAGSDNIIIGFQINPPSLTGTGQLNIGNLLYGTSLGTGSVRSTGNIGINNTAPLYKLDIDALTGSSGNPLRLQGLLAGATSDSLLTSLNGIVRRVHPNQLIPNIWIAGSGTNAAMLPSSSNTASGSRAVVSGQTNTASATNASVIGGNNNLVSGESGSILGGNNNTVSGNFSSIIGGTGNSLTGGTRSTILGGQNLTLSGANVLGFNGSSTAVSLSQANMLFTNDMDLWLGNTNNTAAQLRFYEPNSSGTYASTNYTAFRAGAQGADITYTLPTAPPSVSGHVLAATTGGVMSWVNPTATAWSLTGNSGTTAGTNFLGTTDGQGLAFRTNNTEWMRLNTTGSLGIGLTTPAYKVHVEEPGGFNADIAARLYNTNNLTYQPSLLLQASGGTRAAPTAVVSNTTLGVIRWGGYDGSTFNDIQSVEIGARTTEAWTTTAHGSSMGFKTVPNGSITAATRMTIDQNGNVGIGTTTPAQQLEITAAMRMPATTSSTTGVIYKGTNRFIHDYKPAANDGNNTFIGVNAGNFTMTSATSWLASGNTGVGVNALTALTDAGYNTAVGMNTLQATTTGSYNAAFGALALAANTTGVGNTAIGNTALQANTTASSSTAVGNAALTANTTGAANTALGESALRANTTASQNTALGQSAMRDNTTGANNTAVGLSALQGNLTGSNNVALGVSTLVNGTAASGNTALGYNSLTSATSSNNVGVGFQAGTGTTSGGSNTFVGYNAATTNTTGSNNTVLGFQANVNAGNLTNATAIGNGATVDASNKIRLGNSSVTLVETQGSFVTVSDRRLKTNIADNYIGLNFIKAVRPVKYELLSQKGNVYDGFIAQEIDSILQKQGIQNFSGLARPALKTQNSTLKTEGNTEGGYYTVSYATFVVPLVNAVKELDAKNEKALDENAKMKAEIEKLKAENAALKSGLDKNSQEIEAIKVLLTKKQN
jgi:trimeric autotransporter adhesin